MALIPAGEFLGSRRTIRVYDIEAEGAAAAPSLGDAFTSTFGHEREYSGR
jgi:hypothetical protein